MLIVAFAAVLGAQQAETLKNLIGEISKLPIYRDGRLQAFVYSGRTQRHADRLELDYPIIDLVRKGVDIDQIKYLDNYRAYDLDTPIEDILKFWAGMLHSDGLILSDKAFIDTDDQFAYGKEKVYFRSPMMDLNGVGFRANFKERNVTVESNVVIRLRMGGKDENGKDKPGEPIRVYGDSLYLDFEKEVAILRDNVKVDDNQFVLTCDRLELDLSDKSKKDGAKKEDEEENVSLDAFGGGLGVSKVSCFGKVRIERKLSDADKKDGEQKAASEKAVYDVEKGEIVLSEGRPVMQRGEDKLTADIITIWRETERLRAEHNCQIVMQRKSDTGEKLAPTTVNSEFLDMDMAKNAGLFTGNVRVNDQSMQLTCHRMDLTFADRAAKDVDPTVKTGDLPLDSNIAGSKEIAAIKCTGDVVVIRDGEIGDDGKRAPQSQSNSGQLDYDTKKNVVVLTLDNPIMKRGGDSVKGDKITIWVDERKMIVDQNSEILTVSGEGEDEKTTRSFIKSDYSDLDYGKSLLVFTGNVLVRDVKLNLDCGKMTVFLIEEAKKPGEATAEKKKTSLLGGDSTINSLGDDGNKELEKIYCEENVKVDDPKGKLNCDYLTVYFEPVPEGKVSTEGRVGNREVAKLVSVGNVHFRGKDAPKDDTPAPKGPGLVSNSTFNSKSQVKSDYGEMDLRKNFGFFDGNVRMFDAVSGLTCSKMDIYLKDFKEMPPPKGPVRPRDPSQTTMPQQVGLGFGKELDKIVCIRNVGLAKVEGKDRTSAVGDYGEYIVSNKRFDLLPMEGKKVKLKNNAHVTEHDIVQYYPESGMMSGRNGKVAEGKIPPGTF